MRAVSWLLIVVLLGLMVPSAHARSDTALVVALAPVQTVVDEAGSLVGLALFEAFRDGTPDDAVAKRDALARFVEVLDREWKLPARATYRQETLSALSFANSVFDAATSVPESVALLAVSLSDCPTRGVDEAEFEALVTAMARLNSTRDAYLDAVARAPAGVNTDPLSLAGGQLADRLDAAREQTCEVRDASGQPRTLSLDGDEAHSIPILEFNVRPQTIWRGAEVRVFGTASNASNVVVTINSWNLTLPLPVTSMRYGGRLIVPLDADFGEVEVVVSSTDLVAAKQLTVDRIPATLSISGPGRLRDASEGVLVVSLSSPAPNVTNNATIHISGISNGTVRLSDGTGVYRFTSPSRPAGSSLDSFRVFTATIFASYEGTELVSSANKSHALEVTPILSLGPATQSQSKLDPTPWIVPLVGAIALALAAFSGFRLVQRRRVLRKTSKARGFDQSSRHPASALTTPTWRAMGIVAVFTFLARWLRSKNRLAPSATARTMTSALGSRRASGEFVDAFERVRYGGEPEDATAVNRVRAWARETWTHLTGGTS